MKGQELHKTGSSCQSSKTEYVSHANQNLELKNDETIPRIDARSHPSIRWLYDDYAGLQGSYQIDDAG